MADPITLRKHLVGSLDDIFDDTDLGPVWKCGMVCELAIRATNYEEEGTRLWIDVYLTDNIVGLLTPIPNSTFLTLGSVPQDEKGLGKALKRTAPLAKGSWKIWIAPNGADLNFGIFRDSAQPLNVSMDIALKGLTTAKYIRVRKLAQDVVEISSSKDRREVVHFTNARIGTSDMESSASSLAEIICAKLEHPIKDSTKTYLESLLLRATRESHGTLVAVVKKKLPPDLSDCVKLDPPVDIANSVTNVSTSVQALATLNALDDMVRGMFGSDGIVVFDQEGRLHAYNAFVTLKASNVSGGARRRAFEALSELVGKSLVAAYFQSQDGASELKK